MAYYLTQTGYRGIDNTHGDMTPARPSVIDSDITFRRNGLLKNKHHVSNNKCEQTYIE